MGYQESGIDRIMHDNYFNKTFFLIKQYNTYSTYLQSEILKLLTIPYSTYNTTLTLLACNVR